MRIVEQDPLLERLIAHEARYFEIWSRVSRTSEEVWFLDSPELPDYHSANRALHLRLRGDVGSEDSGHGKGRDVSEIVSEVIAHFRARGLPVVTDVDPIAESLGLGRELRRRGVTPVMGSTLLMRYAADTAPVLTDMVAAEPAIQIKAVPNETGAGEARRWIALAGCDETEEADIALWRAVAEREARSPDCRLYLATVGGQPAGACQLFAANGWAQIDSVVTHPAFRRRGIASRLVACAVQDSVTQGNEVTYLYTENGGAGERVYRRLGFEVWGVDVLRRHIQW